MSVAITRTSAATQASGNAFSYNIDFNCDYLGTTPGAGESVSCEDTLLTIPLGAELNALIATLSPAQVNAMFGVSPAVPFDVVDGSLVLDLGDVAPGSSTQFELTVRPPNFVTPNGTDWSFLPTVTGSNLDDTPAPAAATGQATATLVQSISKRVIGSAFREPGEAVSYRVEVACSQRSTGTILARSMEVTDSLPSTLEFVSSLPTATVQADGSLSWSLSGGTLPSSCSTPSSSGTATFEVFARVKADTAYGQAIVNTAGVTSVTTDGQNIPRTTDDASVTVVNDDGAPGIGGFTKESFGQLRDVDAPASSSASGLESQSHTTYPGNWMGVLPQQNGNVLSGYVPNQASGMRQTGYKMQYDSGVDQGAGFQLDVTDPVPCLDNQAGQVYRSNAPGALCQSPAFHLTTASVWSDAVGVTSPISGAYAPQVVYADGSTASMVYTGGSRTGLYANFVVPDLTRTDISEIVFPRDAGLSGSKIRFGVFGYADESVENGQIAKNVSVTDVFFKNETTKRATLQDDADLRIIDQPQTGIEKDLGNRNVGGANRTTLRLTSRLRASGTVDQDFVVTDLLPTGMTAPSPAATAAAAVTHLGTDGVTQATTNVTADIVVIDNWQGSGRQLVRMTIPKARLVAFGSLQLELSATLAVAYINEPGTYNNTAEVYYTDADIARTCQQSPAYAQGSDETSDLNENGSTTDRFCFSSDSLTIPPPTGGAAFRVTKTVQGDEDAAPKAYPGIGLAGLDGGGVDFGLTWKNTGGSNLKGAVIYDVFPAVGDKGVGGSVAGKPRNSQFDATFVSIGTTPAGVTVAYSTADNPCRPEVFPNAANTGCVDDWTTAQPADKTSITAIRLTSATTYAPGAGFTFNVQMNVPEINEGDIAWNSIAGAAVNATTNKPLNPNSPPKVGITATSAGIPLLIAKTLDSATDPSAVEVGDTLTYHLSVSNPDLVNRLIEGSDTLPAGLQFTSITADPGTPAIDPAKIGYDGATRKITWTNLTIGSGRTFSWTVKAAVRNGASGDLVNDFAVDSGRATDNACATDPTTECVGVRVASAELTVTKAVSGPGASFASGPYRARVSCVADGATVVDQTVTLAADASSAVVPVPYGSTCATIETDDNGATTAAISPSAPLEIVAGTATYAVTVTNSYDVGRLVINKTLTGAGTNLARTAFTFEVVCTFETRTVYDDSLTLTRTAAQTVLTSSPIGPLPIGASCTVTETDNGGADATPVPVSVVIVQNGASNTVTAQFTNEFSAGHISVAKDLVGDWAATGSEDDTVFTVLVTCQLETPDADGTLVRGTVFSGSLDVKGGQAVAVTDATGDPVDLPLGTHCFGAETEDGGATSVDIDHDSFATGVEVVAGTPADPQALTITIINSFDAGALVVAKEITGVGASLAKPPFSFDVVCTFEGRIVHDDTATVTPAAQALNGRSAPVTPLPVGASCVVSETGTGGADEAASPVTVIVSAGLADPVTAELSNAYSAGMITVTKKLAGKYASERQSASFTVRVVCEIPGTAAPLLDSSVTLRGGETRTVSTSDGEAVLLPAGASCFGIETDDGGADSSSVDHGSASTAVRVVAGSPSTVQSMMITATNQFDTSALDDDTSPDDDGTVNDRNDALPGLLPGTGGPSLWVLGLGLLGVLGGTLLVRRART